MLQTDTPYSLSCQYKISFEVWKHNVMASETETTTVILISAVHQAYIIYHHWARPTAKTCEGINITLQNIFYNKLFS
jgi:hypothetical protein